MGQRSGAVGAETWSNFTHHRSSMSMAWWRRRVHRAIRSSIPVHGTACRPPSALLRVGGCGCEWMGGALQHTLTRGARKKGVTRASRGNHRQSSHGHHQENYILTLEVIPLRLCWLRAWMVMQRETSKTKKTNETVVSWPLFLCSPILTRRTALHLCSFIAMPLDCTNSCGAM